ncbi:MAG: hypothetical protein EOO25_17530, partial [Comamonadaceae bacterium]
MKRLTPSVRPELVLRQAQDDRDLHPSTGSARNALVVALALALSACAVGPQYTGAPAVETPAAFQEGQGEWVRAAPADLLDRGPWWQLFNDPVLDALAGRVEVSNNNIAAAVASYAQARALTREQRASLFPSVGLDVGASRSGGRGETAERRSYQVGIGASWEPDVFGRLRRGVDSVVAAEQASQADLAAARLAVQGELAVSYFGLRDADLSLACATRRSAAAMSGRRCSKVEGRLTGTAGTLG